MTDQERQNVANELRNITPMGRLESIGCSIELARQCVRDAIAGLVAPENPYTVH